MKKVCIVLVTVVFLTTATLAFASGQEKGSLLNDFRGAASDSLNEADLALLSSAITGIYDRYKFSDEDITGLGETSISLVTAISGFSEQLESSPDSAAAPRTEVKQFCTQLEGFLGKYKVSAEDTLNLGKAITLVAMNQETGAPRDPKAPTRDDMGKVFTKLIDFSKKHQIQAADLVPIIYQLSDIGLSVMKNQAVQRKLEKSGQRKTGGSSVMQGVSGEQLMGLARTLMGFSKKYGIELREVLALGDDISRILRK